MLERQHLEAHDYQASGLLRDLRGFNDVFLLDFIQLYTQEGVWYFYFKRDRQISEPVLLHQRIVFSRSEIQTIYVKVASVIVSIVTAIATNQNVAHPLPRVPRQRQDCTMWQMPALFGASKEMKSYFLPLGFQFCPSPDPMRRCDLHNCSEVCDVPWRIFEGCMHSFHISCLKGVSYCIICEKGITDAVKKLSAAASSSYLGDSGNCPQSSESTSSVDGDDPGDLEECISANETNVEQLLVGLTQKVISFQSQLRPPPVAKNPLYQQNLRLLDNRLTQNANQTTATNASTLGKAIAGEEINSHAEGALVKSAWLMVDRSLVTAHGTVNCPIKLWKYDNWTGIQELKLWLQ